MADLRNNFWRNTAEIAGNSIDDDGNGYIDDVWGVNIITGRGSGIDDNGHGSHVAGTICANGNDGFGVVGLNWNCRIMPVKFLDASGEGSLYNAVRAVEYVNDLKQRGIPVVLSNNSWGGGGYSSILKNAIARARSLGLIFVAAAGNFGSNNDNFPNYPSSYNLDNIISVAAIDREGRLAGFSNFGTVSVDIAAPGVGIVSSYFRGSEHVTLSGTSMAAPHVSGALMLLAAQNPSMTWQDLRNRTYTQARPSSDLAGKVRTGRQLSSFLMLRPDIIPTPIPRCQKGAINVVRGAVMIVFKVSLIAAGVVGKTVRQDIIVPEISRTRFVEGVY